MLQTKKNKKKKTMSIKVTETGSLASYKALANLFVLFFILIGGSMNIEHITRYYHFRFTILHF